MESADLTIVAATLALIVGTLASIAGGAIGGIMVGGKSLGNELAALMGGFYGPLAGIAGLLVGLIVIAIIG